MICALTGAALTGAESAELQEVLEETNVMSHCSYIKSKSGFNFGGKSGYLLPEGRQEGHLACKKQVGCCCGYLSGARCRLAYMAQLMPLPLTVSCFSKIQIGFTFLVLAHPGCPV